MPRQHHHRRPDARTAIPTTVGPRRRSPRGPRLALAAAMLAGALATGCGDDAAAPASTAAMAADAGGRTTYPLRLADDCGRPVTIERAPRRVVSVNQGSTEVLLSLGLQDRLVGTATWTDPVRENLRAANAKVPRLADDVPSMEKVLDRQPELVTASFGFALNGEDRDRRRRYEKLGVATYMAPSECTDRDGGGSGDGPRARPLRIEVIHREIRELARIFDVAERGERLVADLRRRLAAAGRVRAAPGTSVAFWFANDKSPYMAGCCGSSGIISRTLGVENAFADTHDEWPQVSWEAVAERDPDVLVLGDLSRRQQTAEDFRSKVRFLESNPVTRRMTAVRRKRYVAMNGADLNPSIRTVDGAEKLAAGLRRFGLTAGGE